MFFLHSQERRELTERVVAAAAGRVPVLAAAVGSAGTGAWADEIRRVQDAGVDAVVLISSLLADAKETPWAWQERLDAILAAVPDGDLGLYECPVPYKRLLGADQLAWAAHTGRFVYFKDTSHNVPEMTGKIEAVADTRMSMYNAEMQSLVATVRAGGHGFSGLGANIYPALVGWLCEHAHEQTQQVQDVQRLLSIAEHGIGGHYPSSAKFVIRARSGVPISTASRMSPGALTTHQTEPLLDMAEYLESLGLHELAPSVPVAVGA